MGEVKTLRTGFLVFETQIQVVSSARWERAWVRVLCQRAETPQELTVIFSWFALNCSTSLTSMELLEAGGDLTHYSTSPKAWHSGASGKCGRKE